MANSLRAKISKLRHDGNISDSEYQGLIKKLDGHYAKVRADAINELVHNIESCTSLPQDVYDKIYKIAEELKEQKK